MKYIKNISGGSGTWAGAVIADTAYILIEPSSYERWSRDDQVITDVTAGNLQLSMDGSTWLNVTDSLRLLKAVDTVCIEGSLIDEETIADGDILIYDSATVRWKHMSGKSLARDHALNFFFAGSAGGKWMFFENQTELGQATDLTPAILPWAWACDSLILTNKKADADSIVKIYKNMDLVTPVFTWTLNVDKIWAVKNSGLTSLVFNQFDKLSVWIEGGANNPDDVQLQMLGRFTEINSTDSDGSTY